MQKKKKKIGASEEEEKEEEDDCFMLLDVFEACNTRLGEFGFPGRADPAQIFLLR